MELKLKLKDFSIKYIYSKKIFFSKKIIVALEGYVWRSNFKKLSPQEIVRIYKKRKKELLELEGNYLICIVDLKNKLLEFYSDVCASIPLYYTIDKSCLICSSRIKTLIRKTKTKVNKSALSFYDKLSYIPPPYTIFDKVKKLKPHYNYFDFKRLSFINREYKSKKMSLSTCIKSLQENIKNYCSYYKKIGVLATGGLDSSFLIYLAKDFKPHLFFAAILDKSLKEYNTYSIKRCKALADKFNLKFDVIPIKKEEYVKRLFLVVKLMDEPIYDKDLAAVYTLFYKISKFYKREGLILSGMGNNELFDFPKRNLKEFLFKKIPEEINIHKKIAKSFNLDFYAPYLNRNLINYALTTDFKKRKNKRSLKRFLKIKKILNSEIVTQPSQHTLIPPNFIPLLFNKDSFLKFWRRYNNA